MKITLSLLLGASLFFTQSVMSSIITTLNNHDPLPIFNSSFPYAYLANNDKEYIKGKLYAKDPNYISIAASVFYERADKGKNQDGITSYIGDLTGRWNMLSLLPFNSNHTGSSANTDRSDIPSSVPEGYPTAIQDIGDQLLTCINSIVGDSPSQLQSIQGLLSIQGERQLFGFFAVPIKYRKRGVRFDASARYGNLGVSVQTGVADMSQRAKFIDMTQQNIEGVYCLAKDCPTSTTGSQPLIYFLNPFPSAQVSQSQWGSVVDCVHLDVMNQLNIIANALNINLCDFNKTSVEDVHIELFWRRTIAINTKKCREGDWPSFIFTPFAAIGCSIGFANEVNQNQAFSISAGNNGFDALRFNAGFSIDFFNSFELGATAGFTHFNSRRLAGFRLPSNESQNVLYPFKTDVCYNPGDTWHTSVFMNAFNYYDHFSFYAEYVWVVHNRDKITLLNPLDIKDLSIIDPTNGENKGFKPCVLECKTPWSVQVINTGLTWAASPNFTLGVSAQIPIQRVNAYKSTTLMASVELIY